MVEDSLLGPDSSEAKGEVGDHGSDEAGPVEAELTSRCQRHTSLHEQQQQQCQACMPCILSALPVKQGMCAKCMNAGRVARPGRVVALDFLLLNMRAGASGSAARE